MVSPDQADAAVRLLVERGVEAWVCGEIDQPAEARVLLTGSHPA